MMLALTGNVVPNPFKVPFAEADDTIAALPLKQLTIDLAIHLVGGEPLQLLDYLAHSDEGFDADDEVDMRVRATDGVARDPLEFATLGSDDFVGVGFDLTLQNRCIAFGVPVQVEEDFMVDMAAHGFCVTQLKARLKPAGFGGNGPYTTD